MIELFNEKPRIIRYKDKKDNKLNLPEEYMDLYKMGEALNYFNGVDVYFDPADLHSIETIDRFALRFRTLDNIALGDGGEYTRYAHRWNNKIRNFWSVASGVEAIERNSQNLNIEEAKRKIAVYNIDASNDFVLQVMKKLGDMEENVAYKGIAKNIGKMIKKAQKDYSHFVVIGANEENGGDIRIKSINSDEVITIKTPTKKEKEFNKETEDSELDER